AVLRGLDQFQEPRGLLVGKRLQVFQLASNDRVIEVLKERSPKLASSERKKLNDLKQREIVARAEHGGDVNDAAEARGRFRWRIKSALDDRGENGRRIVAALPGLIGTLERIDAEGPVGSAIEEVNSPAGHIGRVRGPLGNGARVFAVRINAGKADSTVAD